MKTRPLLAATALFALSLAACSRDEPERPPTNTVEEIDEAPTPTPTPLDEPTPRIAAPDASVQSNAIDELADAPPPEPDAQMMDDAAATGMTARASRDEPPPQETPAEPVEQK